MFDIWLPLLIVILIGFYFQHMTLNNVPETKQSKPNMISKVDVADAHVGDPNDVSDDLFSPPQNSTIYPIHPIESQFLMTPKIYPPPYHGEVMSPYWNSFWEPIDQPMFLPYYGGSQEVNVNINKVKRGGGKVAPRKKKSVRRVRNKKTRRHMRKK